MIYNVVLVSGVQQSDLVIHISIFFQILFPYRYSQSIECSSLCYTVGPCWLSILYIVVCIYRNLHFKQVPQVTLVHEVLESHFEKFGTTSLMATFRALIMQPAKSHSLKLYLAHFICLHTSNYFLCWLKFALNTKMSFLASCFISISQFHSQHWTWCFLIILDECFWLYLLSKLFSFSK